MSDVTTAVDTIELGDVQVTRVVEWHAPMAPAAAVFPTVRGTTWESHREWLAPHFWDPSTTFFTSYMQTWVIRSEGRTILVDTGLGNHKERPYIQQWSRLDSDFLDRLRSVGVTRENVDIVVNTHVHADHVGWNTILQGREWVPTFPNAQYLIPRADFDFWNPRNGHRKRGSLAGINAALGNQNMFEDSVLPVHDHGQAMLWEESHRLDANLALEPAPGHTPGSSVLTLESRRDRAFFIGDLMHSPLQFVEPDCEVCLSEDEAAAVRQRRRFLERAAETNALVIPAHLPGAGAAEVRRAGSAFAISRWAPFTPAE